jgi:site-specific DNA-methyltransferase (adenine-specific)
MIIKAGDCRDNWDLLSTGDVMITDPPYRAHVHKNAVSQSAKGGVRNRDFGFDHLDAGLRRYICKLAAHIPRWSVIFSDVESSWLWRLSLQAAGATYIRTIPWVRWSMPQLSGDRPPTGCEMLVVAYGSGKGKKHWNGPGNLTHFGNKCLRGRDKHPTEKPLSLMLELVDYFSDKGDMVIDPFVGAGTTSLASGILDRDFVGTEMSTTWSTYAHNRYVGNPSKRDLEGKSVYEEIKRQRADTPYLRSKETTDG